MPCGFCLLSLYPVFANDLDHFNLLSCFCEPLHLSLHLGLGQNKVHFLPHSWYNAEFWIYDENNVDSTGMFLLLLCCVYTVKGFSVSHAALPAEARSAQEAGREHRKSSGYRLVKVVFQTKWYQAQYIKCGECARRGRSISGGGLGIDRQAMSNNLVFSWVLSLSLFAVLIFTTIIKLQYFISIIILFLPQTTNYFFLVGLF